MGDTYTVTLEVDVDSEKLEEQIRTDLTDRKGKKMTGTAEADLEKVLREAISGSRLVESDAPVPIPMAVEWAVCAPIWRKNLERLANEEDGEMAPLEDIE
jgi:hypothetical protein